MQIGALTAFLSYLMQILMAVMMATFMFVMVPRAEVCAERIEEVLDTESSVVPPADAGDRRCAGTATWSCAASSFRYPGAEEPVLRGVDLVARPRRDHRDHRQHRQRQDHAAQPGAAAVRRHRRRGAGRRRRRARPRPGAAVRGRSGWCRRSRTCSPARSRPTCATATRTPPTRSCGTRWRSRRPGTSSSGCRGRAGRADRAGRHQRLRRAAAAARDRPGAGAPAGDLPVRRLVLGARLRHRRGAAGGAGRARPPTRPW